MSFKLSPPFKKNPTPIVNMPLGDDIMGRADKRGNIYTSYHKDSYKSYLPENLFFKHDKFSKSKKNVLRGLHGDVKTWKLISCVYGEIFQVVVDYRSESKNYLKW